ncbi:hypothetical protein VOLCADRAFT_91401 [Volvox carteri f. nagariensis]|uniref:Uncharacterized protein n=1 Tax=Volvox carteri f. nagariensis TaxID=3068 RepID=D8TWZ3_VOLCA|nr:uncharacterized protein VOLCADRAFT_91401 [Volvox carteri f. nagariensis]EFJ47820.1 hypothetical protein VOLCADRAFT_91401 [Volvox carteri f. nagariensis]|eukprot:XP_002950926.1 hypothetical protein VOLCADRAFT_91401 [Volvox carteri f. nagariensis]
MALTAAAHRCRGLLTLSTCRPGSSPLLLLLLSDVNVSWTDVASMPYAIGESSAAILKGAKGEPLLLVMGFHHIEKNATKATMVLDIDANVWSVCSKAQRPFVGHHMAAATYGNKLYLIGGYLNGTTENMQIYDPVEDKWAVGPKPPFKTGAAVAEAIGDTIYYCGGLDEGNERSGKPIDKCAKFHVPSNTWLPMAYMPYAVHHASAATDGKLFYVFAGRDSIAGTSTNPVNYTQIYDPESDTWKSNTDADGPAATPAGRGGMGGAAYYEGYFYVMGGEVKCSRTWMGRCPNNKLTLTSLGVFYRIDSATGLYSSRVPAMIAAHTLSPTWAVCRYNPRTNTWDRGLPGMSVGRHGAFPVVGPRPKGGNPGGTGDVVFVCAAHRDLRLSTTVLIKGLHNFTVGPSGCRKLRVQLLLPYLTFV